MQLGKALFYNALPMEEIEAVVIGAGVVGLACARARAALASRPSSQTATTPSAPNQRPQQRVIHAGIYYASSPEARLCVTGRDALPLLPDTRSRTAAAAKLIAATDDAQLPSCRHCCNKG